MMYYECTQCEQIDRFGHLDSEDPYRHCPNCGEATRWRQAFEGEGVSF